MASTYTLNNGIELIGTGEQSGTWGATTNTNFDLVDTALDGQVSIALAGAGSSGSPNNLPVSDGSASNGRNRMITFTDGTDLGATAYVQLTPNDSEKIIYVRNDLSGSRSIILFQGTYNASNDYEVPAGTTAVVYFDGAGSGAVAANVFNNAYFDSLRLGGVSVTAILDEDNMASDSATALSTQQSIKAYVDAQVGAFDSLAEVLAVGNTTGGTDLLVSTGDDITFADSSKAIFGAGSDLQIYHDGSHSYINESGTGHLRILAENFTVRNPANNESMLVAIPDAGVTLYYDNASKFATTNTGIDVTGVITTDGMTTSADVNFGDNDKAIFGAGSDLQIFHDGSNSYIDETGTGNLRIRANDQIKLQKYTGENMFVGIADGAASIYYDNGQKLATTATGIDVTGTVTSDGLIVDGGTDAFGSTAGSAYILRTGSGGSAPFTQAGSLLYQARTSGTDGRSNHLFYTGDPLRQRMNIHSNGDIDFYASDGTTAAFHWDAADESLGIGTTSPLAGRIAEFTDAGDAQIRVSTTSTEGDARLELIGDSGGVSQIRFGDEALANPGLLTYTHSNNSMSFNTNSGTRMTILSSGNVGIGIVPETDWYSSVTALQIDSGTSLSCNGAPGGRLALTQNARQTGSNYNTGWKYVATDEAAQYIQVNGTHLWRTAASGSADAAITWSESMRIDSSGNLLVGTTATAIANVGAVIFPSGVITVTNDGGRPLRLNRKTSDGEILQFDKNGVPVGYIGARSGDLFLSSGDHGVRLRGSVPEFIPTGAGGGTDSNGEVDLGGNGRAWKNLYLSSGVVFGDGGSLSPTTTQSNTLDMYERGSFVPIVRDDATAGTAATTLRSYGYYIRVGDWVNLTIELTNINTTGMTGANDMRITGLPYAAASVTGSVNWQGSMWASLIDLSATVPNLTPVISETQPRIHIREWGDNVGTDIVTVSQLTSGTADLYISIGYQVA